MIALSIHTVLNLVNVSPSYAFLSTIVTFFDISFSIRSHQVDANNYQECMQQASNSTYANWLGQTASRTDDGTPTVLHLLITLRKLFGDMRELLRRMGTEAGVEIEPPAQTILADQTETLNGVLSAGVPGAGGNDAIFAIVLSGTARSSVEDMWSDYATTLQGALTVVCPLMLCAESGLEGGVRLENMGW